jgi:hypothetical protein
MKLIAQCCRHTYVKCDVKGTSALFPFFSDFLGTHKTKRRVGLTRLRWLKRLTQYEARKCLLGSYIDTTQQFGVNMTQTL